MLRPMRLRLNDSAVPIHKEMPPRKWLTTAVSFRTLVAVFEDTEALYCLPGRAWPWNNLSRVLSPPPAD